MKKYLVTLTADEREQLTALITAGKAAAKKIAHARILLYQPPAGRYGHFRPWRELSTHVPHPSP